MNAAESRQSPAMVDIWFLKVSLVFSQRSLSADRLFSRAVLRFTWRWRKKKNRFRKVKLKILQPGTNLIRCYLSLDCSQIGLNGLGFWDEDSILLLVASDAGLQVSDHLLHLFCLCLVVFGIVLKLLQFITQRLHTLQHVCIIKLKEGQCICSRGAFFYPLIILICMSLEVAYLSNCPFDHRPTGQWGPVDLVIVVAWVGHVVLFHLVTNGVTGEQKPSNRLENNEPFHCQILQCYKSQEIKYEFIECCAWSLKFYLVGEGRQFEPSLGERQNHDKDD